MRDGCLNPEPPGAQSVGPLRPSVLGSLPKGALITREDQAVDGAPKASKIKMVGWEAEAEGGFEGFSKGIANILLDSSPIYHV